VSALIERQAEWIDAHPACVDRESTDWFVRQVAQHRFDEAAIFTSFHQSPLPLALLLRMAGVPRIGAISVDYPGSLLDVRHNVPDDIHEVERALSLAQAMGYELPAGDDGRLAMRAHAVEPPFKQYVVVHPGSTVPARAWFPERNADLVHALRALGIPVVVTGGAQERRLTARVARAGALDLGGRTSFEEFAGIVRAASAVVCGNTAAGHVAAAVGTPVVSIFPPTVPAVRFLPWMVEHRLLGDQQIACAGCRARSCPFSNQPCLDGVHVDDVLRALFSLVPWAAEVA
jgi:ADP-heptose:LPS heptosyltransferase